MSALNCGGGDGVNVLSQKKIITQQKVSVCACNRLAEASIFHLVVVGLAWLGLAWLGLAWLWLGFDVAGN